jgi:hypothetical protein
MSRLPLGGPIQGYRYQYSAEAVGPLANVDTSASVGPLRIIDIITRRWLWAHWRMSTLPPGGPIQDYRHHYSATAVGPLMNVDIANRWAHSGLSTSLFGDGCWPIRECQHLRFGGPIQDHRHHYLPVAVGPLANVDIATRWAHAGLSTSLFGGGCGPTRERRQCYSVGPFRIIDIIIWRRLWTHT